MDRSVARSGSPLTAALALVWAFVLTALFTPACGSSGGSQVASTDGGGGVDTVAPDAGPAPIPTPTPDPSPTPTPAPTPTPSPTPTPPLPDGGSQNRSFGAADGIDDFPVVAVSTDEAHNLWVAGRHSLFVMRPADASFTKFTSRDGLHLADNPVMYQENYCGSTATVPGAAHPLGINTIVGGAPNEVFVGYLGQDEMTGTCADPPEARHSGKVDRVRLGSDGAISVDRLDLASIDHNMQFWHNRTVLRMVYDHVFHPHTLYVGANHGVDMLFPDLWQPPPPGGTSPEVDASQKPWMGDHLHIIPCFPSPCPVGAQKIGWWQGIAVAPDGDLWHAGRWAAGKIRFADTPLGWEDRPGHLAFSEVFGDPYPGLPPVFEPNSCDYVPDGPARDSCQPVQMEGLVVSLTAVSAADDGTAWFGSGRVFGPGTVLGKDEPQHYFGVASFKHGVGIKYFSYAAVGIPEANVRDLIALPNGQVVFAGGRTGLTFFDPASGNHVNVRAGQGIPDDDVLQLELDRMVDPPALHVATGSGAAVIRAFPAIP